MTDSILNVSVSCVPNYFTKDKTAPVNLLTWLTSPKYAQRIQHIRNVGYKEMRNKMKAQLPAITPSGLFTTINERSLVRHSGFIQFDIDARENAMLANYHELKEQLCRIKNVAYCGLSASGTGYWGLVHIQHPHLHAAYWLYMYGVFTNMGIHLDEAPKNICSLRGYSYDADAYFNHHAPPLEKYVTAPPVPAGYTAAQTDNCATIQRIVAQVVARGKDITEGYNNWFSLGCCIAANFGMSGCVLFHELSQFHPTYSYDKTNEQYTHCLKHAKDTGIGVLVKRAKGWH